MFSFYTSLWRRQTHLRPSQPIRLIFVSSNHRLLSPNFVFSCCFLHGRRPCKLSLSCLIVVIEISMALNLCFISNVRSRLFFRLHTSISWYNEHTLGLACMVDRVAFILLWLIQISSKFAQSCQHYFGLISVKWLFCSRRCSVSANK